MQRLQMGSRTIDTLVSRAEEQKEPCKGTRNEKGRHERGNECRCRVIGRRGFRVTLPWSVRQRFIHIGYRPESYHLGSIGATRLGSGSEVLRSRRRPSVSCNAPEVKDTDAWH